MLLTGLLPGLGYASGHPGMPMGVTQGIETTGENGLNPFVASLRQTLRQMLGEAAPGLNGKQLEAGIDQLLNAQAPGKRPALPLLGGQTLAADDAAQARAASMLAQLEQQLGQPLDERGVAELARQLAAPNDVAEGAHALASGDEAHALVSVLRQLGLTAAGEGSVNPAAGQHLSAAWQQATPGSDGAAASEQIDRRLLAERLTALSGVAPGGQASAPSLAQSLAEPVAEATDPAMLTEQLQRPVVNTSPAVMPALLERLALNMGRERRQSTESLVLNDMAPEPSGAVQGGAAAGRGPATPVADARPLPILVHTPLNDPQWQQDFSSRVTMLAKGVGPGQTQVAEIRLNPAQLGPIEVRVVMNDDQASITFTAQHATVREAIESSLPRLRDMFVNSGVALTDASVSDQSLHERRQGQQKTFADDLGHVTGEIASADEHETLIGRLHMAGLPDSGTLDLYA